MSRMRIARPVSDLPRSAAMYLQGLEWRRLGAFADHQGFDGVMLGPPDADYHLEFTPCRAHPVTPTPTAQDLLVLYVIGDEAWAHRCRALEAAGFVEVPSFNPYWAVNGRTFVDHDGYRTVVERV